MPAWADGFIRAFGIKSRMKFLKITLAELEKDCYELANKVKESNFKPDIILGIARGGLVPAVYLSDALDVRHIAVVQIKLYGGRGKMGKLEFLDYTQRDLTGKKILVVDDVSDTGKTLLSFEKWLAEKKVGEYKIACLHTKPGTVRVPDYYISETDAWLQYPWNKREEEILSEKTHDTTKPE